MGIDVSTSLLCAGNIFSGKLTLATAEGRKAAASYSQQRLRKISDVEVCIEEH